MYATEMLPLCRQAKERLSYEVYIQADKICARRYVLMYVCRHLCERVLVLLCINTRTSMHGSEFV